MFFETILHVRLYSIQVIAELRDRPSGYSAYYVCFGIPIDRLKLNSAFGRERFSYPPNIHGLFRTIVMNLSFTPKTRPTLLPNPLSPGTYIDAGNAYGADVGFGFLQKTLATNSIGRN